ncbi:solute carrier family 32 (vesicular inhibitory amino acid transporter), partial [Phenoliferia sp. Uapishka_3]
MATRRIPIAGQRAAPQRPAQSHFQSSLDRAAANSLYPILSAISITVQSSSRSCCLRPSAPVVLRLGGSYPQLVFSFSRSQAFFRGGKIMLISEDLQGENLPSSPSFVARYRRPGFPEDEESSVTAPSDGEHAGRTTSDDGMRGGEESIATTESEDWSEDDIDAHAISWDNDAPPQREQLPRNAVANVNAAAARKTTRPTAGMRRQPSSDASTSQSERGLAGPPYPAAPQPPHLNGVMARLLDPNKAPTERSALLPRRPSATPSFPSATDESPQYPRRFPTLSTLKPPQAGKGAGGALRRLSVISAEAWSEAIEESRGMSTFGQTLFNTVNVLIGVGLLAEPLAFADAGWICGTLLLLFCALITNYTAKMLARIMSQDPTLLTYSDVLIKAYGPKARSLIHLLFVFELSALSIALVVLFSDSMASIFPSLSSTFFKFLSFFIILPTTFLPLRFLSLTSLVGIISTFMLIVVLISDGVIKTESPGSLWQVMPTDFGPRWGRFPLSFGLMMSGFAGHAVIPSLYRDMREPKHFDAMINTAYVLAFAVSMLMGVLGYLMFGNTVSDEIIRDMRHIKAYPPALNKIAVWMIAINPVVKYALASTPLVSTIEHLTGLSKPIIVVDPTSPDRLDGSAIASEDSSSSLLLPDSHLLINATASAGSMSPMKAITILAVRPLIMAAVVLGAIIIPNFGIVLSFLGSSSAFVICAIGPIGAYLILGRRKDSPKGSPRLRPTEQSWKGLGFGERILCWLLLVISIVLAVVGTVWTCLPHHTPHRKR